MYAPSKKRSEKAGRTCETAKPRSAVVAVARSGPRNVQVSCSLQMLRP